LPKLQEDLVGERNGRISSAMMFVRKKENVEEGALYLPKVAGRPGDEWKEKVCYDVRKKERKCGGRSLILAHTPISLSSPGLNSPLSLKWFNFLNVLANNTCFHLKSCFFSGASFYTL
jgi:hypothetical protein